MKLKLQILKYPNDKCFCTVFNLVLVEWIDSSDVSTFSVITVCVNKAIGWLYYDATHGRTVCECAKVVSFTFQTVKDCLKNWIILLLIIVINFEWIISNGPSGNRAHVGAPLGKAGDECDHCLQLPWWFLQTTNYVWWPSRGRKEKKDLVRRLRQD